MSETDVKRAIVAALNMFPGVHFVRIHTGGYRARVHGAPAGTPDITGSVYGRSAWLEVKKPGGTTSKKRKALQGAFLAARRAEGCIAEQVESVAEAVKACGLDRNGARQ